MRPVTGRHKAFDSGYASPSDFAPAFADPDTILRDIYS
jgi:hypothetical protein